MVLSKRLETIAQCVPPDSFVYDVGADHGLLEKYLLDNKKVKHIVAVENKIGPFHQLKSNLSGYQNIDLLLSDGIEGLTKEANVLVLAGLGGLKIIKILSQYPEKLTNIQQIVIDAHRDIPLVRKAIVNYGFMIEKETLVFENGIYYFVISFVQGHSNYNEDEYEFGYKITQDKLFFAYKKAFIDENLEIVKRIKKQIKMILKFGKLKRKLGELVNYENIEIIEKTCS